MDRFQLFLGDIPAGSVRQSWEYAAQDAVSAGVAIWVWQHFPNSKAIKWSGPGKTTIAKIQKQADFSNVGGAPSARHDSTG